MKKSMLFIFLSMLSMSAVHAASFTCEHYQKINPQSMPQEFQEVEKQSGIKCEAFDFLRISVNEKTQTLRLEQQKWCNHPSYLNFLKVYDGSFQIKELKDERNSLMTFWDKKRHLTVKTANGIQLDVVLDLNEKANPQERNHLVSGYMKADNQTLKFGPEDRCLYNVLFH